MHNIFLCFHNLLRMIYLKLFVHRMQYMLQILSSFIPEIPPVAVDGIFGKATRAAVLAAQRRFRLPETGVADAATWNDIYDQFSGIENISFRNSEVFPITGNRNNGVRSTANTRGNSSFQSGNGFAKTSVMTQFPGRDLSVGSQDPVKQEVVR